MVATDDVPRRARRVSMDSNVKRGGISWIVEFCMRQPAAEIPLDQTRVAVTPTRRPVASSGQRANQSSRPTRSGPVAIRDGAGRRRTR